ncbi:LOW QUALITY PROTEIN: nuclear receptor corepressor 1-like [Homalodisca vitripennis]|uniref:LOW QUALITY PROTEIN: nuclear receptor corepressor 1-like n=1 Tax=Homalodisca vitripennis TaxID=197043 RepID=UPI001EEB2C21|nr:LOW QUALITY PROTEIN: nuclear receptor corepressor 1-like [Homalodisca vitripennis]
MWNWNYDILPFYNEPLSTHNPEKVLRRSLNDDSPQSLTPITQPPQPLTSPTHSAQLLIPTTQPPQSLTPTTQPPQSLTPTTQPPQSLTPTTQPPLSLTPTSQPPQSLTPTTQPPQSLTPITQPPQPLTSTTHSAQSLIPTTQPPQSLTPTTYPLQSLTPTTHPPQSLTPTTHPPQSLKPTNYSPTTLYNVSNNSQYMVPSIQAINLQDLGPPVKKICFDKHKHELQQQVSVEILQEPLISISDYKPQVETISPLMLSENFVERLKYRTIKDEILQKFDKLNREISKVENTLLKLKNQEQELVKAACQPNDKKDDEEERLGQQPKLQPFTQKIYDENRRKVKKAVLEMLGPKFDFPLYNQPSDTAVYHENKKKHAHFKNRLMSSLIVKKKQKIRDEYFAQTYTRLMQEWHRKVEKIENSPKRKTNDAKNRKLFEKVFPELIKQRENQERFNRIGTRIKSDADLEEIMDGLQKQEMEKKKMRLNAVIPPLLLNADQRKYSYINTNGKIEDLAKEYKERQFFNIWTEAEVKIFKEMLLQHHKNFSVIASYLEHKSVGDCIQYYYQTKKEENYKSLLRKQQRKRSSRNNHRKVNVSAGATNSAMDLILSSGTGVTTRLQFEQMQKKEHPPTVSTPICDKLTVETSAKTPVRFESFTTTANVTAVGSVSECETKQDKKKKERKEKKEEGVLGDVIDGEMPDREKSCTVWKNESEHTGALRRSHVIKYDLTEEDMPAGIIPRLRTSLPYTHEV